MKKVYVLLGCLFLILAVLCAYFLMKEDEEPTYNSDFCKAIDDCIFENAMDWYDESEVDETFDEYLEECTAEFEEISVQEYEENTAEWLYEAQIHSFEHQ